MIDAAHPLFDDDQVSATDRLVAFAIDTLADPSGWCWASTSAISAVANLNRNAAGRACKRLENAGWIATHTNPHDKRQTGRILQPSAQNNATESGIDATLGTQNNATESGIGNLPAFTQKIRDKDKEKEKEKEKPATDIGQVELLDPAPEKPAKTPARRCTKKPKLPIAEDWLPSEATMANLVQIRKIPLQFVKDEIIEFIIYWHDQGESRASWDATFCNRVKSTWKWSQNDEKKQKFTDATGRPISEYDAAWRDNGEGAWQGYDGFDVATTVHRDADGNETFK